MRFLTDQISVSRSVSLNSDTISKFSEFDTESVINAYAIERSQRISIDGMAPTTTIETVTITRPLKVMTAEAIQKAALKSQKRKQQADEKREKDKKKTMERILKKQETKSSKNSNFRPNRNITPWMTLRRTYEQTTLSVHTDIPCPILPKIAPSPPKPAFCAMRCGKLKKYSCSKTGVSLCSLKCYKKNISTRIL